MSNNLQPTAIALAVERWGVGISAVMVRTTDRGCIVVVQRPGPDGPEVLALAQGPDAGAAWRNLIGILAREDVTLDTAEVAALIGRGVQTVRNLVRDGLLTAVNPDAFPRPGQGFRFAPGDVARQLRINGKE